MNKLNVKKVFQIASHPKCVSTGLLLLRLVVGSAFVIHGWGKIQTPMSWMPPQAPVPGFLQFLAALSEFGGGACFVLGFLVPLASFGIGCTMAVAVFMHVVVMGDPFVNGKGGSAFELPLTYLVVAVLLFLAGPGKFSLDKMIFGERQSS